MIHVSAFAQVHTLTEEEILFDDVTGSIISCLSQYDSINIPDEIRERPVRNIGPGGFLSKGISGIYFPATIKSIGIASFAYNKINTLQIPDNVEYIGDNAFQYNAICSLHMSQNIKHIGHNAFSGNSFATFTIPNSLDTIRGFTGAGIRDITIPSTVSVIDSFAFSLNHFDKIYIEEGVRKINYCAFRLELSRVGAPEDVFPPLPDDPTIDCLEIPYTVTDIEDMAFYSQLTIRTLNLNEGLVNLGDYSFWDAQIDTLIIPSTVEHIGQSAFEYNGMDSLHLGSDLTFLGAEAFAHNHLQHLSFPPLLSTLPSGCFMNNHIKEIDIPSTIRAIGPSCFAYNNIRNVSIAGSVATIDSAAFMKNVELSSITLDEGVVSIGAYAFAYCSDVRYDTTRISKLILPSSLRDIKPYAFYYTYLSRTELPQYNNDNTKKLSWYKYSGTKDNIVEEVEHIGGANFALTNSQYGYFAIESDIPQGHIDAVEHVLNVEDENDIYDIYEVNGRHIGRGSVKSANLPRGYYFLRTKDASRKIIVE